MTFFVDGRCLLTYLTGNPMKLHGADRQNKVERFMALDACAVIDDVPTD